MMPAPPGLAHLRRLQLFRPSTGMWANLGMRIASVGAGTTVVEADLTQAAHGGGAAIHRGAVAAIADGALACAGATLMDDGEAAATVELRVDFFQPAREGRVTARGEVLHREGHLVYCAASVEQGGAVLAEARATVALVARA